VSSKRRSEGNRHVNLRLLHIRAYLRGCGVEMGNRQGFDKHSDKKILLMVQVLTEAVERYPEAKRFKDAYRDLAHGR